MTFFRNINKNKSKRKKKVRSENSAEGEEHDSGVFFVLLAGVDASPFACGRGLRRQHRRVRPQQGNLRPVLSFASFPTHEADVAVSETAGQHEGVRR